MARILVIDDDHLMREFFHDLLEREGFEITEAFDGEEGVQSYFANPADLVITDILMPENEGLEIIRELLAISQG